MTEAQRDEVLELLKSNSTQHTQKLDTIINLIQNLDFGIEGGGTIPTPPVPDTDFIVDDRENKLYTRIFEKSIEWTVPHTGVYEVFLSGGGGAGGGSYSTKGGDSKFSRKEDNSETLLITAAGGKVGAYLVYSSNYLAGIINNSANARVNNTINTDVLNAAPYNSTTEYNYPTTRGYNTFMGDNRTNIHTGILPNTITEEEKQQIRVMATTGEGSLPGGVGFGNAYIDDYIGRTENIKPYWVDTIGKNVNSSKLPQGITRNGLSIKPGLQGFSWTIGLNFTNMNGMKYGSGGGSSKNATRENKSNYITSSTGGQGGGFVGVRLSLRQGDTYIIRIGAGGYTPQDNNDCAGRGAQGVCMINLLDSREDL